MSADFIPIANIGWECLRELLKHPCIELVVVFPSVIAEGSFQLAVGLRVTHRCMDESNTEVRAKGREKIAVELRTIIKDYALRDRLVLPHGGDHRADGVVQRRLSQEGTIDVGPRVVIHQR